MNHARMEMVRMDIVLACGRAIAVFSRARKENVTTENEHKRLICMPESEDLLTDVLDNPSTASRTAPYMSMLSSLKKAADSKVIILAQLKDLVERLKASEHDWMRLCEMHSDRYVDMINVVFPEHIFL